MNTKDLKWLAEIFDERSVINIQVLKEEARTPRFKIYLIFNINDSEVAERFSNLVGTKITKRGNSHQLKFGRDTWKHVLPKIIKFAKTKKSVWQILIEYSEFLDSKPNHKRFPLEEREDWKEKIRLVIKR